MKPSAARALAVLQRGGWVEAPVFVQELPGWDFRSRINELRHEGHAIESERVPGKKYNRYRLVSGEQGCLFAQAL